MTTITAKIVADSVSPEGIRLTTLQLRYPKIIHGEFMTHRVFSRNASSSRAIPVERLIQDVIDDPYVPIHWGANQRGMKAEKENDVPVNALSIDNGQYYFVSSVEAWLGARDAAVDYAQSFAGAGYHKQIVNRLLEPFCHINVVVTATEWSNFFALRCHEDAQPEMRALAETMRDEMGQSTPQHAPVGCWHNPYVLSDETASLPGDILRKLSVARCARVSYLTQDGKTPNVEDDLKLYDRLVGSAPLHASPAEHQATPDERWPAGQWKRNDWHSNFRGWIQYRKTLPNESM
jgi:thymidylate synthase ThyX